MPSFCISILKLWEVDRFFWIFEISAWQHSILSAYISSKSSGVWLNAPSWRHTSNIGENCCLSNWFLFFVLDEAYTFLQKVFVDCKGPLRVFLFGIWIFLVFLSALFTHLLVTFIAVELPILLTVFSANKNKTSSNWAVSGFSSRDIAICVRNCHTSCTIQN